MFKNNVKFNHFIPSEEQCFVFLVPLEENDYRYFSLKHFAVRASSVSQWCCNNTKTLHILNIWIIKIYFVMFEPEASLNPLVSHWTTTFRQTCVDLVQLPLQLLPSSFSSNFNQYVWELPDLSRRSRGNPTTD